MVLLTFAPDLWGAQLFVYASLIALPVAAIHGILRYGAFDIAPGDRGRLGAPRCRGGGHRVARGIAKRRYHRRAVPPPRATDQV